MDYYQVFDTAWVDWGELMNDIELHDAGLRAKKIICLQLDLIKNSTTVCYGQAHLSKLAHMCCDSVDGLLNFINLFLAIFKSRRYMRKHVQLVLMVLKLIFDDKFFGKPPPTPAIQAYIQILYLIACSPVTRETYICDFRDLTPRGTSTIWERTSRKMGFVNSYSYIYSFDEFQRRYSVNKKVLYNLGTYLMVDSRYRSFYCYYNKLNKLPIKDQYNCILNDIVQYEQKRKEAFENCLREIIENGQPIDQISNKIWRPHSRKSWVNCHSSLYLNNHEPSAYNIAKMYGRNQTNNERRYMNNAISMV